MTCAAMDPAHQHLVIPDGSIEGLGILCEPSSASVADDSAIDVGYDNSLWESQINQQILQFQQTYQQNYHANRPTHNHYVGSNAPDPLCHTQSIESIPSEPAFDQQDASTSSVSTNYCPEQPIGRLDPSSSQQIGLFAGFEAQKLLDATAVQYQQLNHDSQYYASQQPIAEFSGQTDVPPFQTSSYDIPAVFATPYLQPSADINESFSRRLSVSSNAPSSVFSAGCQTSPYFMTPCTTPRFASNMSLGYAYTPMSGLSSPVYPTHSRSQSSSSLKVATPGYKPIRAAPYSLDAAQRQRWSTGKTMSLPSRRTQPPDFSLSPGHMRTVSEHKVSSMYSADDFTRGDRSSFNESLNIIRQGVPKIMPSIESDEPQTPKIKTEDSPQALTRPALAAIQLKSRPLAPAPVSSQFLPPMPPLKLPELLDRPVSPPSEDFQQTDSAKPRKNMVAPNDSYTPKYSRGKKGQLEGFCGLCKPGRWLNMKTSAYWYDKQCNHGINPRTKRPFDLPLDRRWKMGSSVIREGLCGACNQWTPMDSCKRSWKKWWKHAHKCHNKIRDYDLDDESEEDDIMQDFGSDKRQPMPRPSEIQFQYAQHINYGHMSWPYPSSQNIFNPDLAPLFMHG